MRRGSFRPAYRLATRTGLRTIRLSMVAAVIACVLAEPSSGQNNVVTNQGMIDEDSLITTPLPLTTLPKPSEDVARLLERGQVKFKSGGPRPSQANGYRSTGVIDRQFDAETQFRLNYDFVSRCRWWWSGDVLWVRVRYPKLGLTVTHDVWLRTFPTEISEFWNSDLIKHELDHIRLSTDPRVLGRFRAAVEAEDRLQFARAEVEELLELKLDNPSRRHLTDDQVRQLINSRVKAHFQQTFDLIVIRYRELDRQTAHGAFAVPQTGPLRTWLDQSSLSLKTESDRPASDSPEDE